MTVRTTLLLLSLVFAIAQSADPKPVSSAPITANVTLNQPLRQFFGPWNLVNEATVIINHTEPITVCVVNAKYGSPNETQYSEEVCTWFHNLTVAANHQSRFTLPALIANYSIGVYFVRPDSVTKDNITLVTVEVEGEECAPGHYYSAGQLCTEAVAFQSFHNETLEVTFEGKQTKFFTWNNPARVPELKFRLTDELKTGQPEDYVIKARYNGNPNWEGGHPADSNGTVTKSLPLPGLWVFSVYRAADTNGTATLGVSGTECAVGSAGERCPEIPLATNNTNLTITADTGQTPTYHFYFAANVSRPLLVSVTTFNQSHIPKLYVTRGQLPATDGNNAEITNCNRNYCNAVHSIAYNGTDDEDWYITVQTSLPSGNVTFGIWFSSHCVTGCMQNARGQCLADGTCRCYLDFTGIDCSVSEGLGAPYIVLIIIASLVVASAVVGFVAWAYMRRKRNDYETLS